METMNEEKNIHWWLLQVEHETLGSILGYVVIIAVNRAFIAALCWNLRRQCNCDVKNAKAQQETHSEGEKE